MEKTPITVKLIGSVALLVFILPFFAFLFNYTKIEMIKFDEHYIDKNSGLVIPRNKVKETTSYFPTDAGGHWNFILGYKFVKIPTKVRLWVKKLNKQPFIVKNPISDRLTGIFRSKKQMKEITERRSPGFIERQLIAKGKFKPETLYFYDWKPGTPFEQGTLVKSVLDI